MNNTIARLMLGVAGSVVAGGVAMAGGFAIKEQSVKSQGTSHAGYTAAASDITFMYNNPAALQRATGKRFTIGGGASAIIVQNEVESFNSATGAFIGSDEPGRSGAVASTFVGFRLAEPIAIGLSVVTPFGLATDYEDPNFTNNATRSELKTFVVTPTIAFDLHDRVTFGAGFSVIYADAKLNNSLLQIEGDDIDYGFNVGALFDLTSTTTLGIAYKSGFDLRLSGDGNFTSAGVSIAAVGNTTLAGIVPGFNGDSTGEAKLPALISVGLKQQLTPKLDLLLEGQWQQWSSFDTIVLDISNFSQPIPETQNYKNAFFFAGGLEWQTTDQLTLRTGVAWDQTPTRDEDRTLRVPDEDRIWLSAGATFKLTDSMSIDAAYSYLRTIEDPVVEDVDPVTGTSFTAEYDASVHIFSFGATLDF